MIRAVVILLTLCLVSAVAYFTVATWAIRHQTVTLFDAPRNRPVKVFIAVRRDKEMQAEAGLLRLPVAIINHGNTVRFTEYSFLANLLAARGYMAVSIQHDLATDAPLMTNVGEPYVGRLPVYQRGVANIDFVISRLNQLQPNAGYDHLTMVGHSNGGDISMYYAMLHPDRIRKVVTLDNLRVPFIVDGKFKTLSFRSEDPAFKTDPGVVPDPETCDRSGITVVNTGFQHTEMSDRGPDHVKDAIARSLDRFLDETTGAIGPAGTGRSARSASVTPGSH